MMDGTKVSPTPLAEGCYSVSLLSPGEIDGWDELAEAIPDSCFMQSASWARFKEREGYRVFFAGVRKEGEPVGGIVLYCYPGGRGPSLLAAPGGPLLPPGEYAAGLRLLTRFCGDLAGQLGVASLRIEPAVPVTARHRMPLPRLLDELGFVRSPADILPSESWVVDLDRDEAALSAGMKPKGRYNVRVARRHGVQVRFSTEDRDIPLFYRIFEETARRKRFFGEPYAHFINLCQTLFAAGRAELVFATLDGETLAAILVVYWGGRATYLYGGRSFEKREAMAPYLLHWEAMLNAKARGCRLYDFYGYSGDPRHSYFPFSRFKRQFGGRPVAYHGAHDRYYYGILADTMVNLLRDLSGELA
ncbi:peptidoglycan bridge formation glycyltransferase FemA/FemB family protein [Geomonas sp. Red32]|uniref:lipid II:glycine glycyltransferase FemX n=1 Tax=Geomonas sp. Red32 TaxID=2912856 RepID=UPI00202CF444|nr:peptidoglycan bridge formation glycyltransferase FemA/FemB family protein [Geomonas sp. Red32]MCM0083030.1 peptidoglycan bridge formation glycyltransferase FemA/FemB family protein [Geomonas sp. Red32]